MKNLQLHTPTGLNDLLPADYQRKRTVERSIEAVFESYGYAFVSSPTLEYLAVFEGKGSIPAGEMYKLGDKNGDMLALRPDMTPAVARMAVTHNMMRTGQKNAQEYDQVEPQQGVDYPLRLCYIEKAFRDHERFLGRENEFTQAGAELMGDSSPEADAELIALAVQGLLATGLKNFRVDIGQVDFLPGILEELQATLSDGEQETFMGYMIQRDYVAAESLAAKAKHNIGSAQSASASFLSDLTQLTGGMDMLARARSFVTNEKAQNSLKHLEEVYSILRDQGLSDYILIDLSMTGQLDYYTGVIFKGYAKGSGTTVVDGGRYDRMLTELKDVKDKHISAMGFGIKVEGLLDALAAQGIEFEVEFADTLLAYHSSARAVALRTADIMRQQKLKLEVSLLHKDAGLEAQKVYALGKGLKGVLYFADPDVVLLVDLSTGEEQRVRVDELVVTF